ncbi:MULTISPECIES: Eco57I restriction-modification methylase domain-containing protein [unclassified Clostridioides]|uniref:Eco57I restriction-modification methylase domain-containing protein n=1 Tax=unclassified Clostridioides TaxID=2635829 RepID=UPI001D0C6F07|nr:N-6 DNA methylase [Clostridioides sp. ES-S-0001-02]MCC0639447.1 N-6 DNA methylase [Clostridioides sp. ES-S-0049-03]MCC0651510.1 N-6 DNA methylase [Clostridioides sp. ES-S-0001-03]MCC0674033.1 N-6 DNA methylase [Clostridioides sp. ES-S-0145-01]MCC0676627.1 N-6 DNA methylase [Clostridioides sp. ES-W-0018-02]MCC0694909.1 N-6 DNA methylase [Clostridioides sp. ES-S-0048-02]MCC0706154.1 N-6 DNA methylase [Clostridioides sp. ES-S-0190-01]MCC0711172.1 N-6 DNA methylase [Clostridioides sp. ES-W-00
MDDISQDNFLLSKEYENSLDVDTKKAGGIYYTPKIIVDYIVKKTLRNHDIIKNPYPRILDISCGCGNFLLEVYDILYDLFEKNIYELKNKYDENYWQIDNIHNHILNYCIYGADIDENAINILKDSLKNKKTTNDLEDEGIKINLFCCDSLKKNWRYKFDYIVGNPPYIGHKKLEKKYKKFLLEKYSEVYKDKADLYFCFYKKIIDILKCGGTGSVITPRYFLESLSGKDLRDYIKSNVNIKEIVDFLGANIFKNIGVSSCILTFNKKKLNDTPIDIFRIKNEDVSINKFETLEELLNSSKFEYFNINQNLLSDEWIIVNKDNESFYNKIQEKGKYSLEDIAVSFQGIITGCDKAFILSEGDLKLNFVDEKLLKDWIKSKNINKYVVEKSKYKLIYSNDIDDEVKNKKILDEIIGVYKTKLENRRECKSGIRKWYELQWGREKLFFERKKIMYPYKSKENRFAIDYDNNFSSADVYSFFIKDEYLDKFSYEYLVGILNSSVYDKYFKITAKKMSKNIYDYYPNKVMKIRIFRDNNYEAIEDLSKQIISILLNETIDKDRVEKLQIKIDKLVIDSLGI